MKRDGNEGGYGKRGLSRWEDAWEGGGKITLKEGEWEAMVRGGWIAGREENGIE